MSRFEVATARRGAEGEAWRFSVRQVAAVAAVGVLLLGALYLFGPWTDDGGATAIALGGGAAGPAPKVGDTAPDFALEGLRGGRVALGELRGRPVLVNFWATWCPPCRAEMPDLDEAARERADTGLVVVAVNLQEEPAAVAEYLGRLGVGGLTIALDRDGGVFRQYRITGLPTTVAVGRDGVVREIHVGPLSKAQILARVAKVT